MKLRRGGRPATGSPGAATADDVATADGDAVRRQADRVGGDPVADLLDAWMPAQRWWPAKGRTVRARRASALRWASADPAVAIFTHVIALSPDDDRPATPGPVAGPASPPGPPELVQVPLTYRSAPAVDLADALIGDVVLPRLGRRWVYDGPHDPAFVAALLRVIANRAHVTGDAGDAGVGPDSGSAWGVPAPGAVMPAPGTASRVLNGEQSNTSIIIEEPGLPGASIVKLFRVLHPGENPDVVVGTALAAGGCERVPAPVGSLEGAWAAGRAGVVHGHLAYACEFVAGSEDAWRVACRAVELDRPFADEATELGLATAQVHQTLAEVLPTASASPALLRALAESMTRRLELAIAAAPLLRGYRAAAVELYDRVRTPGTDDPQDQLVFQRVHGDLHLGQVLHSPSRGWVLLDFEGEPLRPLVERSAPDLALRDVAGMLRSFDYAARHATVGLADDDPAVAAAERWAATCRAAFLEGYAVGRHGSGAPPIGGDEAALLRALELDKAMYEVVYETRNRPDWVAIPLHAVQRLVASDGTAARDAARNADTTAAPDVPVAPAPSGGGSPMATPPSSLTPATAGDADGGEAAPPVTDRDTRTAPAPADETPADVVNPAIRPVDHDTLARVGGGAHHDPHSVLGPHVYDGKVTVRTLRPFAQSVVAVLADGSRYPLQHEHDGVWVGVADVPEVPDYRLEVTYPGSDPSTLDEPYRYLPTLGEIDLHLFGEGRHEQLWEVLGAHVREYEGLIAAVVGTSFAVWAPNARAVRVVADFNHWNGREHTMRSLGASGVWELFVPGVGAGTRYKFEILGADGWWRQKADPMAYGTEVPPSTASVVAQSAYSWNDAAWMEQRKQHDPHEQPMSTYEVHIGSWRQGLSYRELADQLVGYVKDMGFTHVEFMPVAEHPFGGSWGYQVTSYYAPSSRFGHPDDFRFLVDTLHQAGIGVIVDWVPAHFPKDEWALARFDGSPLYEYGDPRRGEHPDWGTLVFDFGRREVRNFLVANALYWLEEFHIDGLRVDAVASMLYLDYSREDGQWVPNVYGGREHLEAIEFLQETNATAYKRVPGIVTIAEESTAWPGVTRPTHLGGLGFGMKWNMGWMNDSLTYVSKEPVHRQYHHHQMTFSLMYAFSENFVLPISHDEVVHGKGSLLRKVPGDRWQQLANVRAYLAFMWAHPGKQLIFMGVELGQESEWSESRSLDWWLEDTPWHAGLQQMVRDLNRIYRATPALWTQDSDPAGFEWIDANDSAHNTFSFVRWSKDSQPLVCIANFSGVPHEGYRVGLPFGGRWSEVLNTDAQQYAGSGVGNFGSLQAEELSWHGRPASVALRVPPLAALWLAPATD